MRIVIENGGYGFDNVGDTAMLQVAVSRLQKIAADAYPQVFTESPERLLSLCPGAVPLGLRGRGLYIQPFNIVGGVNRLVSRQFYPYLIDCEHWLRSRAAGVAMPWMRYRLQRREPDFRLLDQYRADIAQADLVVASGGGYINDSFPRHAEIVLRTLQLAQSLGKPTALLGQGIGPLALGRLRKLAGAVLRHVNLIGLREGLLGPRLLADLGVPESRIVVTGDDAIELAYCERGEQLGRCIGVNLRVSAYSHVGEEHVGKIRATLEKFSKQVTADFMPIPIAYGPKDADLNAIATLLGGQMVIPDELQGVPFPSPPATIKAAGLCRVVVTGSYHAAVFALSQGVPVVGVSASEYYVAKFSGLKKQFGDGVEHVLLNEPDLADNLRIALQKSWDTAASVRPLLLAAAERQIGAGTQFYARVVALGQEAGRN